MTVQDNSIEFSYAYFTPKAEGTEETLIKTRMLRKMQSIGSLKE